MHNNELGYEIAALAHYALEKGLIAREDLTWAKNRIANLIGEPGCPHYEGEIEALPQFPQTLLDKLTARAADNGIEGLDSIVHRDIFDTELMAVLTPRPSEVIGKFNALMEKDPEAATDWYYDLSRATNYIRAERCAKDLRWSVDSPYGKINISVNLSKPEKDPKAIAAARFVKKTTFPPCALCCENEGYGGTLTTAARGNHRIIPITLGGEQWYLQYSPYVYYNEHCICLSGEHRPMAVSRAGFERLLDFVDLFPHYFVGSNADLPIVGGSILTHDHFQGGRAVFPMELAPVEREYSVPGCPEVSLGIVKWPLSVIRLESENRAKLASLAEKILSAWRGYSDPDRAILAQTEDTPHNTITPIARIKNGKYQLDLVLRNNRTTDERPLGLFHPAPDRHHIKKENIGLIEVMGLAVLPARLKAELARIEECLLDDRDRFYEIPELEPHTEWYRSLCERRDITPKNCTAILRDEAGKIFAACLEDCGVFTVTPDGREGFDKFIRSVIG
ncbi:MAG: UDP-glucose--hexose-1-phosphate uridylyltransferase [Ruminococcaceae bacterium]|nr:UDP-glucose--hexose-1-phosphate uridylyltransferase [Oscillospiraceae bacterium]